MKLMAYTDGGSRGNPGPAALGVVIKSGEKTLRAFGEYLGEMTNNQAEYLAVVRAIEEAKALGGTELDFLMDSELIVKQMNGVYRVKHPNIVPLFMRIWNLRQGFRRVTFRHIPRERNWEADSQVNAALDKALGLRS